MYASALILSLPIARPKASVPASRRPDGGIFLRYFFHIVTPSATLDDREGADFADFGSAKAEALQCVRDLIAEELRAGRPSPTDWRVHVAREGGGVEWSIPFSSLALGRDRPHADHRADPKFDALRAQYVRARASIETSVRIREDVKTLVVSIGDELTKMQSLLQTPVASPVDHPDSTL